jgi:predicted deacetylase
MLKRFQIRPILAIVPDNQDPELKKDAPDPTFWAQMQEWQASGATIALHGYQHLCLARGRSLVNLHSQSEFAGVPFEYQRKWIRLGLSILRGQGLQPTVWVAPRHGFDPSTLDVLRDEGIRVVSDGFAKGPYRRSGMIWIPQQLWAPVIEKAGLWTIAYHSNNASDEDVDRLESFLERFHLNFTSVERVISRWPIAEYGLRHCLHQEHSLLRMRLSKLRMRLLA